MDVVMPKTFFSKILERLKDKGECCFAVCKTKVVNGWHFLKSKVTNALNWSSSSDDEDQRYVQVLNYSTSSLIFSHWVMLGLDQYFKIQT